MSDRITTNVNSLADRWLAWMGPMAWQVAVLVAVLALATWLLRKHSARLRYALWMLVPARLVLPPTLAFVTGWGWWVLPPTGDPLPQDSAGSHHAPVAPSDPALAPDHLTEGNAANRPGAGNTELHPVHVPTGEFSTLDSETAPAWTLHSGEPASLPSVELSWKAWLFSIWFAIVLMLMAILMWGARRAMQMVREATLITGGKVLDAVEACRTRLGIRHHIEVRETAAGGVPMLIGIFRKTILFPAGIDRRLTTRELEAVLVHELQHVARRDTLTRLVQAILGALYFFHPLVWLANRRLGRLREDACDEATLSALGGSRRDYGTAIFKVAESITSRAPRLALGVVESGRELKRRLLRILDPRLPLGRGLSWVATAFLLIAAAVLLPAAQRPQESSEGARKHDLEHKRPAENRQGSAEKSVLVRGRVVDPDGKPVAGARVLAANWLYGQEIQRHVLADVKAGEDGRFEFTMDETYLRGGLVHRLEVAAVAPGHGPALMQGSDLGVNAELTLRLVTDQPIRGRVLDLEGRPVADARVKVHAVGVAEKEDAGLLIQSLQERQQGIPRLGATRVALARFGLAVAPTLYPEVRTDGDGRFVLRGLGRERHAELVVESATITTELFHVIIRPGMPTIRVPKVEQRPEYGKSTWYGSEFTHAVEPCRPVVGSVRDAKTGQALAGVRVAGTGRIALPALYVDTTTDERGRFRLTGLPGKEHQRIMVLPGEGQPYPVMSVGVPADRGLTPATVDIHLPRGVRIEGTVRDKSSGQPVQARVSYFLFVDDPEYGLWSKKDLFLFDEYASVHTASDGRFALVGLSGRGVVAARASSFDYLTAVGADRIEGLDGNGRFITSPIICIAEHFHALAEVSGAGDAGVIRRDLVLDPGMKITGRVVDANGKKLSGALVRGLTPVDTWEGEPLPTASFTVTGLRPKEKRTLLFLHDETQSAAMVELHADKGQPVTARVVPWGTLTGRLVDANGNPRPGIALQSLASTQGGPRYDVPVKRRVTDKDGRFRITGLVPGLKYSLGVLDRADNANRLSRVAEDVVTKEGQTIDLGDVK
jgi:beta-lactamase regulating signal transducer with metallopeptidase domain/protocatechuate 3,4-dioxygenase beta subunit